jgi:FixJ family two-component response regulator
MMREPEAPPVHVVDDEPTVRDFVTTALAGEGMEVLQAADGAAALGLLGPRGGAIDGLLLDVQLPDHDGFAVLERVTGDGPGPPDVMMTGHGSIPDVVEAIWRGGADYLMKPLSVTGLVKAVLAGRARRPEESRDIWLVGGAEPLLPRLAPLVRISVSLPEAGGTPERFRKERPLFRVRCPGAWPTERPGPGPVGWGGCRRCSCSNRTDASSAAAASGGRRRRTPRQ